MWVKIEVIPSDHETIYLPACLQAKYKNLCSVTFGHLSVNAEVKYANDLEAQEGSTYERPVKIRLTDILREKLQIPDVLVYQCKISEPNILLGPVIGFLLGIHTHRYNAAHMTKYSDRFGIYNKVGGLIYAFSPKSINWKNNTAYGLYYNISKTQWEYGHFPLPEVIYRRDFHSSPKLIKELIKLTNGRLFNSYRYTKIELYNIVRRDPKLCKYLPPTETSRDHYQLKRFINNFGKVILKPIDLSRGRGICIIEKKDTGYRVIDYRHKSAIVSEYNDMEAFDDFLSVNRGLFCKYLIQKYLPLARIDKSPFDIRVVMHKGKDKTWGCTGIECRVSNGNSHITNISRGGYALSLGDALRKAFPTNCDYNKLSQQIHDFCIAFCQCMDNTHEHYAELGMDVAVDVNQNLWLIEANVFPSFKGFKKMDYETYLSIRYKPLLYALSLTEFGV